MIIIFIHDYVSKRKWLKSKVSLPNRFYEMTYKKKKYVIAKVSNTFPI